MPRSNNPYGGPGLFQASDFVSFIAEYYDFLHAESTQRLVNMYREGAGLTMVAGAPPV